MERKHPQIIIGSKTLGARKLDYIVQIPAGLQSQAAADDSTGAPAQTTKRPLYVSLHGAGGHLFIDKLINGTRKSIHLDDLEEGFELPMLIFAPRLPNDSKHGPIETRYWIANSEILIAAIEQVISDFNVDEDRVYLGGFSMGGVGTWDLASKYPDHFAAIMPIAGAASIKEADRVKNLPVWIFHTNLDPIVPFSNTNQLYEYLFNQGADVRMSVFTSGHDIDKSVFSEGTLRWLLAQNRPNNHKRLLKRQSAESKLALILSSRPVVKANKIETKDMSPKHFAPTLWDTFEHYNLDNLTFGAKCASAKFALAYDDEKIYVHVKVTDAKDENDASIAKCENSGAKAKSSSTRTRKEDAESVDLKIDTARLYNELAYRGLQHDCVDLFFDFFDRNSSVYVDGCIKFRITRGEQKIWFGDMRFAKTVPDTVVHETCGANGTGYTVEIAIPFPADFNLKINTSIGFDVQVNDTLSSAGKSGERLGARTWADTSDTAWSCPQVFGDVKL